MPPKPLPLASRLWRHIERADGGCWLWTGAAFRTGYGATAGPDGRICRAHRIFYELLVEPIPKGLQLDHLCRNRLCVNPTHLEPVTQRENLLRGQGVSAVNARKTHCIRGHEFTSENTIVRVNGWRDCKTCRRERAIA